MRYHRSLAPTCMHISPPKTKKRDYVHMLARPNRGDMRSRRQFWPVRAVISDPAKKTPPGSNPTTRPRLVSSRRRLVAPWSAAPGSHVSHGSIAGHRPAGDAYTLPYPAYYHNQHSAAHGLSTFFNGAKHGSKSNQIARTIGLWSGNLGS